MNMLTTKTMLLAAVATLAVAGCGKDKSADKPATSSEPPIAANPSGTEAKPAAPPTEQADDLLAKAAGSYEIDPVHTQVLFRIKHFGVSHQYGRFNQVTGALTIDGATPSNSSVELKIAADSVFTANKKRDTHLRSPDFFDAKQFPSIDFKSSSITARGEQTYDVAGSLSMHGVTKDVTITMQHIGAGADPYGGFRTGFEGRLTIKRSDFGINFMPEGLGDEVEIIAAVEAVRK